MDAPGTLWFSGAELSTNLYVILVKRTFIWTKKRKYLLKDYDLEKSSTR